MNVGLVHRIMMISRCALASLDFGAPHLRFAVAVISLLSVCSPIRFEAGSFDIGGTKALLLDILQQRIMAKMRII